MWGMRSLICWDDGRAHICWDDRRAIAYLLDDERAIATGFTLNVSIPLLARGIGLVVGFVGVLLMGLTEFSVGVCRSWEKFG